MTQIPAGWYPDPAPAQPGTPTGQRYWDGQQWTANVSSPSATRMPYGGPGLAPAISTTPDGQPLAGWWSRVGAAVIDGIIVGAISMLLGLPLLVSYVRRSIDFAQDEFARLEAGGSAGSPFDAMTIGVQELAWLTAIGLVVGLTYHALFLRRRGATPGKMVIGLEVRLRDRPGQLPWSTIGRRLLVQNVATLFTPIPFASLVVGWFPLLDGLWPLWDDKKQALHDKAARTNVVLSRR